MKKLDRNAIVDYVLLLCVVAFFTTLIVVVVREESSYRITPVKISSLKARVCFNTYVRDDKLFIDYDFSKVSWEVFKRAFKADIAKNNSLSYILKVYGHMIASVEKEKMNHGND